MRKGEMRVAATNEKEMDMTVCYATRGWRGVRVSSSMVRWQWGVVLVSLGDAVR